MNTIEVETVPADCAVFVTEDSAVWFAELKGKDIIYHFKSGYVEYWCVPLEVEDETTK